VHGHLADMVTNTRANLAATTQRHSLDAKQGSPAPVRRDVTGLRQEQSSPAVVQQTGDCSLLKAVVSASGQGAPALLNSAGSHTNKAIWRSRCVFAGASPERMCCWLPSSSPLLLKLLLLMPCRSVRNKLESYAILQLKGRSNRDVTVQVHWA
jgi:hypothetical protein